MKQLLTIFCLLACLSVNARNIYVSSSVGNDGNTGLDSVHPWRSIAKVNSVYTSAGGVGGGDSILFKRGDVFYGAIVAMATGLAGKPIVITAYGTGAKPIISGFVTLHTWTNAGGNIWQCTPDSVVKANTNVLTINGVPQAVGRTGWQFFSSATATTLTSSSPLATSYVGAEVVIRKSTFVAEKAKVTAQSGTTITYSTSGIQPIANGNNAGGVNGRNGGNGFFFQRFAGSMDAQGEWYFNKATNKLQIYSTTSPAGTIKVSYIDTLITMGSRGYTTISNIAFEGAGVYAIESYAGSNVTIDHCDFNNNTKGVYMWNTADARVENNYFNNSFNGAIIVSNKQNKRINVNYNEIHNTGQLIGMGVYNNENSLRGIVAITDSTSASNYVNVIGNRTYNTGNAPINFQGSNVIVRRNVTDTFANVLDDMGGIYTFINNQSVNNNFYRNRIVDSNFVGNAIGAPLGQLGGGIDVAGIYMDDQTCNVIIKDNTVWNVPGNGIQMNTPKSVSIIGNTIYNCSFAINLNKRKFGTVSGVTSNGNTIYQKTTSQENFHTVSDTLNPQTITQWVQGMITSDNNWVSDLKSSGYVSVTRPTTTSGYTTTNINLATWKATYLQDVHAISPPITVTTTNTRIVTNPSDSVYTSAWIGSRKLSSKNVSYDNYINLQPWTSAVVIDNGSANIPPVSSAGADLSTSLPKDSATLTGNATDADGSISTYLWVKVSGPTGGVIGTASAATTKVRTLTAGIYQYSLTATDNSGSSNTDTMQLTVLANQPPSANAGADQTLANAGSSTSVLGVGTDPDGTVSTYNWAFISGPNTPTLATASLTGTGINGMVPGVYLFKYTVTDNGGLVARDTVQITVQNAVNQLPVANAGTDFQFTAPTTSSTLSGSATDADGTISSYDWAQISGPNSAVFGTQHAASTTIGSMVPGIYYFELTATDNSAGTGKDTIIVTVNAAANQTPLVDAGVNQIKVLPISTATLAGTASDPDGSISTILWTKEAGSPAGGTISNSAILNPTLSVLQQGVYQYKLTVTDNHTPTAGTAFSLMQITVNANPAPVANAGADIIVTQPATTTTLNGSGTDDVSISSYSWRKISGTGGAITSSSSASTLVTSLSPGVYQFELTVTDNGSATGKDTVQVTVNLAANILPVANASIDRAFDPPRDTITIFGSGTDSDGSIVSYAWRKILGPAMIINDTSLATIILSNLISGTYQLELTVTDDRGGVAKDTMQLVVNNQPFNIPPIAHGPADMTITLPLNHVTLVGSGSDPDATIGSVLGYAWTGGAGTVVSPNAATTDVTGLPVGDHLFYFTVIDEGNLTNTVHVWVHVLAAPVKVKHVLLGVTIKNN